ncbi:MAG TPA: M48 family metalloprotease, partial [Gemmata sp.]|nr:M48 family metalloprotease [Gemmata sp.]
EVGHAKHGHMWLYLAFLLLSVAVLAAFWMWLMLPSTGGTFSVWLKGWIVSNQLQDWLALVPVFLLGSYMFVVFGLISRRCERQADIYGCRAVSCDDPNCTGHNSATRYPERARGLCNSGIHTFARALEHVNYINGQGAEEVRGGRSLRRAIGGVVAWFRHWMHSTPQRRIDFVMSLTADRSKERRFQRAVAVLRWGLLLGLLCALVALGEAIGWHNLVEEM